MDTYMKYLPMFDDIWENSLKNQESQNKPNPEENVNPDEDCAWNLSRFSSSMAIAIKKMYALIPSGSKYSIPTTSDFRPYVIHGNRRPGDCSKNSGDSTKFIKLIEMKHRVKHFHGTRIENTTKHIIRDFNLEKRGIKTFNFTFKGFSLKIPKGGEGKDFIFGYKEQGIADVSEIFARVARDINFSPMLFMFLRNYKIDNLSIASAIGSPLVCIDYVGTLDDSNIGGQRAYDEALQDGLELYGGLAYAVSVDMILMICTFMKLKVDIVSDCENSENYLPQLGEEYEAKLHPTPAEFMEARFVDAAMTLFCAFPAVLAVKRPIPMDMYDSPLCTRDCYKCKRAVNRVMSYNDMVDVNHDVNSLEPFNELHIAGRYGGIEAVLNFADACASCVDDVASCLCPIGDDGHDYATDLLMGSIAWYLIYPRYRAFTQFAEISHITNSTYNKILASCRHGAFVTSKIAILKEGGQLHDDNWKPLYTMLDFVESIDKEGNCNYCEIIGNWLVNRCLHNEERKKRGENIKALVKVLLHHNENPEIPGFWEQLIRIVAKNDFSKEVVQECVDCVNTVWVMLLSCLKAEADVHQIARDCVRIEFRLEKVYALCMELPKGYVLARAMNGALTAMAERTHCAAFKRAIDLNFV